MSITRPSRTRTRTTHLPLSRGARSQFQGGLHDQHARHSPDQRDPTPNPPFLPSGFNRRPGEAQSQGTERRVELREQGEPEQDACQAPNGHHATRVLEEEPDYEEAKRIRSQFDHAR